MTKKNNEIEQRIIYDVVVDAYNEEERAMGWYYYVGEGCSFPFKAKCISKRGMSPLKVDEIIDVIDIAADEDCDHEVLVKINWKDTEFAVPLEQLEGINIEDEETQQILGDWAY